MVSIQSSSELIKSASIKTQKSHLLQLMGQPGTGCRRLALRFAQPARRVAWISPKWNLHAPLLWKIGEELGIQLLGIESAKSRFRTLCQELLQSEALDAWIFDQFHLTQAEGFFLQHLTRNVPLKILILDHFPHTFCRERIHIELSHHHYRLTWSKGGSPTPQYWPAEILLQHMRSEKNLMMAAPPNLCGALADSLMHRFMHRV